MADASGGIAIRPGGLDDPRVRDLLRLHQAEGLADTPPEHAYALDADELAAPGIDFFTAWDGDTPVGIAALRVMAPHAGEVKSMRTALGHLRRGIAAAMLAHLIAAARARGLRQLYLETGTAPRFAPAVALYRTHGFRETGAFGAYAPSPHNLFMLLELT